MATNQPPDLRGTQQVHILSAHKLVFIGDTSSRGRPRAADVRSQVTHYSNLLCELLRASWRPPRLPPCTHALAAACTWWTGSRKAGPLAPSSSVLGQLGRRLECAPTEGQGQGGQGGTSRELPHRGGARRPDCEGSCVFMMGQEVGRLSLAEPQQSQAMRASSLSRTHRRPRGPGWGPQASPPTQPQGPLGLTSEGATPRQGKRGWGYVLCTRRKP